MGIKGEFDGNAPIHPFVDDAPVAQHDHGFWASQEGNPELRTVSPGNQAPQAQTIPQQAQQQQGHAPAVVSGEKKVERQAAPESWGSDFDPDDYTPI